MKGFITGWREAGWTEADEHRFIIPRVDPRTHALAPWVIYTLSLGRRVPINRRPGRLTTLGVG